MIQCFYDKRTIIFMITVKCYRLDLVYMMFQADGKMQIFIDIYGFRKTLAIRMRCQQSITTLRDLSDHELAGRICFGRIWSDGHRNILQHGLVMIILNGSFYSIFLGRDQCQSTED